MDIREGLIALDNSDDFGDDIVKQALHQQEEMAKKVHILKTVSLANKLEDMVRTNLFKKDGIEILQLNTDLGDEYHVIEFTLIDKNAEVVATNYAREGYEQAEILFKMFRNLDQINFDFVHEQLRFYSVIIELKPGIKEELLKALLTEDLKKLYDYNKMQIELSGGNNNNKRIKI